MLMQPSASHTIAQQASTRWTRKCGNWGLRLFTSLRWQRHTRMRKKKNRRRHLVRNKSTFDELASLQKMTFRNYISKQQDSVVGAVTDFVGRLQHNLPEALNER